MSEPITVAPGERPKDLADNREAAVAKIAHQPGRRWSPGAVQFPISERRALLVAGDIAATVGAILVALYLWAAHAHEAFTVGFVGRNAHWFVLLPVLWLLIANTNDYYDLRVAAKVSISLLRLLLITAQVLLVYLAIFFLSPPGTLPRRFIVYYAAADLVLAGLWRAARVFLIGWTGFRRRAVVVGVGQPAQLITRILKGEAAADYQVIGSVTSRFDAPDDVHAAPILGTAEQLPTLVAAHGVSELIMAYVNEVPDDVFAGVLACYERGVTIVPMPVLYEQITGRIAIEHVKEHMWTLVLPTQARSLTDYLQAMIKRLIDCVIAVLGLVAFAPFFVLLAAAIKVDSRGPVLYRQVRLGRGGHPFKIVKLRSMRADAELHSGAAWAQASDPRVTRVGRFLRLTRLDEVPQLLNVVRGEMSLVGPRPERPEFVDGLSRAIPFYRSRLVVKPGLTGWAQVRFRYGSSVEDALVKLQYDLYYVRHQSLGLDLVIMLKTLGVVALLRGT